MMDKVLLKKCSITNLAIETNEDWQYNSENCSISIRILNKNIILCKNTGKFRLEETIIFSNIIKKIISTYKTSDNKFYLFNDFIDVKYAPINARKYYINFFKENQNSFEALVYYNVPPFFKLSITLTKKLYKFGFKVNVFKDYEDALNMINIKYSLGINLSKNLKKYIKDVFCEVSGLRVTERKDWKKTSSENNHSAEFKFIGKNILYSSIKDISNLDNILDFFTLRKKVINSFLLPQEPFFEICDYSKANGNPSKYFRIHFNNNMNKDSHRLIGYIAFNTSILIKLNLKVIFSLNKAAYFVSIEKNYENTIIKAVEYTDRHSTFDKNELNIISRTDWTLDFINFQKTGEIIGNNILHTIYSGLFKPEYSNSVFNLNEKIISEKNFDKKGYFIITGIRNLKSINNKNRKIFLASLKTFYLKHPFEILIIYGIDNKKKNIIEFLLPQLPFKVKFTKDLSHAISIAKKHKADSGEHLIPQLNHTNKLEQYKDDILNFIGSLNWEFKEVDKLHKFDFTHPFIDVINAISLVKSDMDSLITENKKKEEEIEAARESAEEANRIKTDFLSNISHEIRTPINGIIGASDLLKENHVYSEKQTDLINIINKSSSELLELVDDILNINRLEYSRVDIDNNPFSIKDIIKKIENKYRKSIISKKLKFEIFIDTKIPEILIGDSTKLIQILQKLIGNAIKFTNNGSINISINIKKKDKEIIFIEFNIKDTGIGIDSRYINNIFTSFSQEDTSLQRAYGGTGLGLSIVKKIIDHIDGKIFVKSKLNYGTEFQVILPFIYHNRTESNANTVKQAKDIDKVNILIVEDNLINQKLAQRMLSKKGFKHKTVENGLKAIEILKKEEFSLILMDIQMPVMTGIEATNHIRNNITSVINPNIPIIAFTAHAMVGDREKYLKIGMNDYISKPFKYDQLIKVIEKNLI